MARISIYNLDNNVTALDKVIGTDFTGSVTKNFSLIDIANLFSTGLIAIAGQVGYKFVDVLGEKSFSGPSDNQAISTVTTIKASSVDGAGHNIQNFIQEYNLKRIILFKNKDKDIYGIFDVTSIIEDINNPGYYDISLTFVSGNGNLELDEYYSLSLLAGEKDKHYTHNQNNAASTWNVTHNLNKHPSVSVVLSTGQQGIADVQYIDKNELTITLLAAQSGKAYLN
jgi:hypothetical protein